MQSFRILICRQDTFESVIEVKDISEDTDENQGAMQNEEEEALANCNVISDCSSLLGSIF